MKVLVTGANGQLGRALVATAPASAKITALDSAALDITSAAEVERKVAELSPELIVNAAAYTAVDRAEEDEQRAMAVNAHAVRHLAQAAAKCGARLVQVSSDFVFDGASGRPYRPDDPPSPLGAYGRSKLAGEQAAGADALIVRTAWVYSADGHNFVRTMLRLMAEREELRVVADQVGTPTWASSLARAIWTLVGRDVSGIQHYTDSGVASWYDFAVAIHEEASALGLLRSPVRIVPIATSDYPTPAKRPSYSVLDKSETYRLLGGPAPHWRDALRQMLEDLTNNG